ncbi:hypothetical protein EDB85DRAFT_1952365 [Lactarius pseudohatsudake]|nr:hypothetical protein EDB85DRAFT_1952365 [Lactarius pseudohatsudake]
MSVRVSARRSVARRARAATSVFEAPGKVEDGVGEEIKEADAFRARVEALRSEMGDGWLKVFSQSHAGFTRWSGDGEGDARCFVVGTA